MPRSCGAHDKIILHEPDYVKQEDSLVYRFFGIFRTIPCNTSKKKAAKSIRFPSLHRFGSLDQGVGAGPAVEDVQPRPADQDVIAVAAGKRVVACAPVDHVVAAGARELDVQGATSEVLISVAGRAV